MDDKMALYRECCFPICKKSRWIKLLSQIIGAIAPPWIRPSHWLGCQKKVFHGEPKRSFRGSATMVKLNFSNSIAKYQNPGGQGCFPFRRPCRRPQKSISFRCGDLIVVGTTINYPKSGFCNIFCSAEISRR